MLVLTVLTLDAKEALSSLIITYPPCLAAGTLLALGVEAARAIEPLSQDAHAGRVRDAPPIPPADFIYYLDIDTEAGKHLRLFQAHYAIEGLGQGGWSVVSALLPRTQSVVLLSPPLETLDEDVLNPLLNHLRALEIAPESILLTVCMPTQEGLPCSQQQVITILKKRQILKPHYFGLVVKKRHELAAAYHQACPNFWNQAQGELGAMRLMSCALGRGGDAGYSRLAGAFRECAWSNCVDLSPRRAVEMACAGDVRGLLALQVDEGRRRLLLSTLKHVALHSGEAFQRTAVINIWNQIDDTVGTDWLLPLLTDDDGDIHQAAVDAVSSRLPRSGERLVNMALDEEIDQHGGARRVIIDAAEDHIVELLIDVLDSPELSRRRAAQGILAQLSKRSRAALTERMQGGAYRGRIGAASVLARLGFGSAQRLLQSEFDHTRPSSGKRRIVQEGFEAWDPVLFRRLVEEEQQRGIQRRIGRGRFVQRLLASRGVGAMIGSFVFIVSNLIIVSNAIVHFESEYQLAHIQAAFLLQKTLYYISLISGLATGIGASKDSLSLGDGILYGIASGFVCGLVLFVFGGGLFSEGDTLTAIFVAPFLLFTGSIGLFLLPILANAMAGLAFGIIRRVILSIPDGII